MPPPPPGQANPSGTLVANLTGVGVSPPPLIAVDDAATTALETPVTINVLANDSGGVPPLSVAGVTPPAHGSAALSGNAIVYTPTASYTGTDSFGYTVRDNAGQTATATVTVTVTPRKLIAVDDAATTPLETPVTINVLANDSGGVPPLSVAAVTPPAHGSAALSGNAIVYYTPAAGYTGTDSFGYTVRDNAGQTATATVTVTVTVTPRKLIAVDDAATTPLETPVTINVLANDSGGVPPLSISAVSSPLNGRATVSGNAIVYTPTAGYTGADSFGYMVRDNAGQTATATVTVTVTSRKLTAVNDTATTQQGTAVGINVLANDTGGVPPLVISAVSSPLHGTATLSGSAIVYTPTAGYTGTDSFGYTVRDNAGQTATATVTVTVTPRKLTAVNDSATTSAGKPVSINVLANDTGGVPPLRVTAVTAADHGNATSDGSAVTYISDAGYKGTDSFSYTVKDASGQTASATVTVTVKKDDQEILVGSTENPNAQKIGKVIGGLCSKEAASANFLRDCKALVNSPNPGPALEQITPNTVGNAPTITQINAQTQMSNIRTRMSSLRAGIMGIDIERLNTQRGGWALSGRDLRYLLASVGGGGTPSTEPTSELGALGIFASGSLNFGNRDDTENQVGFDFKAFALAVGIDYRFTDQLVLGTAVSYVANDNQYVSGDGSLDTRGYSLALYGTYYQSDNFYIDGILDYGRNDYDQQRNVNYQLPDTEVRQRFNSQYDGQQFFADIGAGYNFKRGDLTFGPEVRLSYLNMRVGPFRERADNDSPGSAWAVAIDEQNLQSLVSKVGGRANYLIDQPWGVLQPQAELSWLHEFKDNNRLVSGQFVEGVIGPDNLFYLLTDPVDPDYFELGLGVTARFNKGPAVLLQYRTLFGYDHLNQNVISAQLRWEF
ncbi:MAG: Ig-like domain-containing protein [Candidatus Contendobacter sp.]